MSRTSEPNIPVALTAGALAWIVPGAGHVFIGRPVRGIVLCLTIAATFWAGVAMGGVMTVDPANEPWWFVADLFTGVHGIAAWQLQQRTWRSLGGEEPRQRPSALSRDPMEATAVMDAKLQGRGLALTSPTDTVARAYSGIAGLMNVMCIFDAMMLSLMGMRSEPAPPVKAAKPKEAGA